jgi:hypothetical protein
MEAGSSQAVRRTAIVVVGGVGDLPSGDNSERVARSLLCFDKNFDYGECVDEEYAPRKTWYEVAPGTDSQQVTRHTLFDRRNGRVVDVYEAWWADLSRFPGATRSALLATVGMLFQLAAAGRAALRGGPPLAGKARSRTFNRGTAFARGATLLDLLEWMVAVPIIVITALHVALLTLAWYTLKMGTGHWYTLMGACGVAAALIGVLVWGILIWYPKKRSYVQPVGLALLACAIAIFLWRGTSAGSSPARGIADSMFALTVYPFRVAWMTVAALALAVIATTTLSVIGGVRPLHPWERIGTAALSAAGAFGLAIVGALIYGGAGNVLQKIAQLQTFDGDSPWCLPSVNGWAPSGCPPAGSAAAGSKFTAFDWGTHLFQFGLTPLLYVTACVVVAVLVAVAIALVRWNIARGMVARVIKVVPRTPALSVLPAAALVIFAWMPGGDRLLVWHGWLEPWPAPQTRVVSPYAAITAAVSGYVVTAFLFAARSLKLSASTLLNRGQIGPNVRLPLDTAYDITSFLREPRIPTSVAPREKMLARIAGLLDHVAATRHYDRTVLLTHSQGTVLATALLDDPDGNVVIPGGHLSLVTMGTPLRSLYCARFPVQFRWVDELDSRPDLFVHHVDGVWINFWASGDLIGQWLFTDSQVEPPSVMTPAPYPHGDVHAGDGDHGSYYTSEVVFRFLGKLV